MPPLRDASDSIAARKRAIIVATLSTADGASKTRQDVVQSHQLRIEYNLGQLQCDPTKQKYPQLRIGGNCVTNF